MTRAIFYVDNLPLAQACVAFAETLGLNVEPDILARLEEGQHLTTASKNFDVNFIKNEAFAVKKAKNGPHNSIGSILAIITIQTPVTIKAA